MIMASPPPANHLPLAPAAKARADAYLHRSPPISFLFTPVQKAPLHTHPSTGEVILHYLLHLSIRSRLKQAALELNELRIEATPADDEGVKERQRVRIEAANRAEKDKNAVESIVSGILSSHKSRAPGVRLDLDLKLRLYLCQATNLIFGRFDANTSSDTAFISSFPRRFRYPEHVGSAADSSDATYAQECENIFSVPVSPSRCRRHRHPSCQSCNKDLRVPPPPLGLMNAIPAFLRASAMNLRMSLEEENAAADRKGRHVVMGGGMPPEWYDLFLDLLTQAAIESYLCDGWTGLGPIFEIFSWGDVEPENDPNYVDDEEWGVVEEGEEEEEEEEEEEDEDEDEDDDDDDEVTVKAADYHLLFPKTRTMFELSKTLREREQEFRVVRGTLEQHFDSLAEKYPLEKFETAMGEYIDSMQRSIKPPMLCKYENLEPDNTGIPSVNRPNFPDIAPSLLKFPGDSALLVPEVDSDDEYETEDGVDGQPAARITLAQLPTQGVEEVVARKRTRESESADEMKVDKENQNVDKEADALRDDTAGNPTKKTKRN